MHRAVGLVDSSKIGHVAFAAVAPVIDLSILITDATAPAAILEQVRPSGVEVMVATTDEATDS